MTQPPYPAIPPSPLDVGQVLGGAFTILKKRLGLFALLSVMPTLIILGSTVLLAVGMLLVSRSMRDGDSAVPFVLGLVAMVLLITVIGLVATIKFGSMTMALAEAEAQGRRAGWSDLSERTRGVFGRYLPMFGAVLLFVLAALALLVIPIGIAVATAVGADPEAPDSAMAGGFLLAMMAFMLIGILVSIAALIFQVRLLFALPIAALEHGSGNVVRASWTMTRGHFWRLLGMTLLIGIVVGGVQAVLQQVAGIGTLPLRLSDQDNPDAAISATVGVLLVIGSIVLLVFSLLADAYTKISQYLLYVDTHRRNRGEVKQVMGWGPQPYGQNPYNAPTHNPQNPSGPGGYYPPGPQQRG